jgi:hypothetical protein
METKSYKTHGGNWAVASRDCQARDLILIKEGVQCCNCGAYSTDDGKTWKIPDKKKT